MVAEREPPVLADSFPNPASNVEIIEVDSPPSDFELEGLHVGTLEEISVQGLRDKIRGYRHIRNASVFLGGSSLVVGAVNLLAAITFEDVLLTSLLPISFMALASSVILGITYNDKVSETAQKINDIKTSEIEIQN
jgi:hypothetical protein